MFGIGKLLGKSIGETAADAGIRAFAAALLRHGIVIAPLADVIPEKRAEAERRTASIAKQGGYQ